jgi:hypothetical protein
MPARWSFGLLSAFTVGLTACSADVPLIADYKVYDLGGSNQVLMGGNGSVSINDVTAVAVVGPLIFVETGGRGMPRTCSYGVIDTSQNASIPLPVGHPRREAAVAAIRAQDRPVMMRSCAAP